MSTNVVPSSKAGLIILLVLIGTGGYLLHHKLSPEESPPAKGYARFNYLVSGDRESISDTTGHEFYIGRTLPQGKEQELANARVSGKPYIWSGFHHEAIAKQEWDNVLDQERMTFDSSRIDTNQYFLYDDTLMISWYARRRIDEDQKIADEWQYTQSR